MDFSAQFEPIKLPLYGVKLPTFAVPKKYEEQAKGLSNYDFLRKLALDGFNKLKLQKDSKEYKEYAQRAKYELETIHELGFTDYILLVWDVINFCKENDIPVGFGRGSAAGSLILYFLGITQIDPIKYGLYFERFISKIRAKKKVVDGVTYLDGKLMCDVDVDICYYNRPKVVKYLTEKFSGRVSKICNIVTLSGKLLIKECGKIIADKSEMEMKEVAGLIPKHYGNVTDIEDAHDGVKDKIKKGEFKAPPIPGFLKWCDENPEVYAIALKLRDLIKNKGVHASGILLSCDSLDDTTPQEEAIDKETGEKHIVSSYNMDWVALINVKLDILANRSVSITDKVCKQLKINIHDIDLNDPFIYKWFKDIKTAHGLFQIEAGTNLRVCKQVKPRNLEELSAVLAIARPGALAYADAYADFVNDGTMNSIHPFFDNILGPSGGVCLYQEQLMKMVNQVGFTLDESELVRRIVGKKKVDEMPVWEKKVDEKIKEKGLDPEISGILWGILDASKDYSFNKSHSIAYAALAAVTTYLKFKYPLQFYTALFDMTLHESKQTSEIGKIEKELIYFDIRLLPPHILKSDIDFKIEGENIRFGLLSIKGISVKSIENLNNFRSEYSNKFEIFQAAKESGLPIGILCALIQAGSLEGLKQPRSWVVLEAQVWNKLTPREKKYMMKFGEAFDFNIKLLIEHLKVQKDDKGKPVITEKRHGTIRKHAEPYFKIYWQNSKDEDFANWFYERHLLGYSPSGQLKDIFSKKISDLTTVREAKESGIGSKVFFPAVVKETMRGTAKKLNKKGGKTQYLKIVAEDESEEINILIFNEGIQACSEANGGLPKEKNIILAEGTLKDNAIFADKVVVQDNRIYMRLGQLNEDAEAEEEKKLEKSSSSS